MSAPAQKVGAIAHQHDGPQSVGRLVGKATERPTQVADELGVEGVVHVPAD